MQNEVCRLQTRGKMREKTTRKMFALVEVRRNPLKSGENLVKMFAFFSCSDRKVCLLIDSPMILWNTLFIKEFCFNSMP